MVHVCELWQNDPRSTLQLQSNNFKAWRHDQPDIILS